MRQREDLGLFFLSVTGAFSLWSATNTSYTGHMAFGLKDPKSARTAMNIGAIFIGLQAFAMLFLYGKKATFAAAGAAATGVALYAIYDHALRKGAEPPQTAGTICGCRIPAQLGA